MTKLPKLTPRLKLIASLVPRGSTVADIGTDHAYIPIWLVNSGIAKHAIASDKSIGPLKIAEENIKHYNCEDKIELRQGDGLAVLAQANEFNEGPGNVPAAGSADPNDGLHVIIGGMGGILIAEILENGKEIAKSAERLILQPMTAQSELREYLTANGYTIIGEHVTREKEKFYYCLEVTP